MPKQLVPDVAQFRLVFAYSRANQEVINFVNTMYVRNTVLGWDGIHLAQTAGKIRDAWDDNVMILIHQAVTLVRVDAEDLGADPGLTATVASGAQGSQPGEPVPLSVCATVTLLGEAGALPRRGRLFISGMPESQVDGNELLPATQTAYQNAINAVIEHVGTTPPLGDAVVIVSRSQGTAAELAAIKAARQDLRDAIAATKRAEGVSNDLTSPGVFVSEVVGSQRDRRGI